MALEHLSPWSALPLSEVKLCPQGLLTAHKTSFALLSRLSLP